MSLMQNFCLDNILPFSKSYPQIESTWPTSKYRERKSFGTWYYVVNSATLCVNFSSKSKTINVFPKHSQIKSTWPIDSSKADIVLPCDSKELFVECFVSFWSKSKARGGAKSKNRHSSWLYCTVVGLPEAATRAVV